MIKSGGAVGSPRKSTSRTSSVERRCVPELQKAKPNETNLTSTLRGTHRLKAYRAGVASDRGLSSDPCQLHTQVDAAQGNSSGPNLEGTRVRESAVARGGRADGSLKPENFSDHSVPA
jgi:hypothetical protein